MGGHQYLTHMGTLLQFQRLIPQCHCWEDFIQDRPKRPIVVEPPLIWSVQVNVLQLMPFEAHFMSRTPWSWFSLRFQFLYNNFHFLN